MDILYVAYNRLAYTQASLSALLDNTDWTQVDTLYVHDDESRDGTKRWLKETLVELPERLPSRVVFESAKRGSPVAVMNWYLDAESEQTAFVKIDNDFIVCPGWLGEVLRVAHRFPGYDALGIAPWEGPPVLHGEREVLPASHIGGIGLIRKRAFSQCRPIPRGLHGWTSFQTEHDWVQAAWLKPDMPCFELDRLPVEPWADLARRYHAKGWSREWPKYQNTAYYSWWTDSQPKEA